MATDSPAPGSLAPRAPIEARNPATLEPLGAVRVASPDELPAIIAETGRVQPLWARLRLEERAGYLRRAAQAVIDEFDEVADLVVAESGRPRAEVATLEQLPAIDTLRWLSGYGVELLGPRRIGVARALHPLKRARMAFEPLGVVAVIGSGSTPLAHPLCQIAAALIGGNGAIYKPSPRASLAAERLTRLLARAGLPEGLVRVVHGGADVGAALAGGAGIARVLFTGSAAVGAEVAKTCAAAGRSATLELAGTDPMIVQADANVPRAVSGALWAACVGAGQAHGTVKRIYVAAAIHDRFVEELVAAASRLEPGDPADPATELGPLASAQRAERLSDAVAEACAEGAVLRCGRVVSPGGLAGAFRSPTVLACRDPDALPLRERLDGPVLAVLAVPDTTAAIAYANARPPGLGASIWTADRHHGRRIAAELRAGTVWINDHVPSPGVGRPPWSAVTGGNLWRSQGADGLRACVQPKLVTWDPPIGRALWWHPYNADTTRAARALADLRSVRDSDRQAALRNGSMALVRLAGRSVRSARRR